VIARLVPAATTAAVALSLIGAAGASAHNGHEGERVVLERVTPPVDGVGLRVIPGAFGKLELTTSGATVARVLGASGEPFLRIGPRGVEANAAAPEWYQDNEPLGIAKVPPAARRGAPARWIRVSTQRTWGWFDHRLHPAGSGAVSSWSVPLAVGRRRVVAVGRVEPAAGAVELRLGGGRVAPGVTVTAVDQPASALRLRNERPTPVSVLGPDGEVFARIGPRGAEVNVRSTAWQATAQYRARDLLSSVIDPGAKPDFLLIGSAPELIWPDPRLLPPEALSAYEEGRLGRLATWTVPVVVGGARRAISGTTLLTAASEPARAQPPRAAAPAAGGGAESEGGGLRIAIAIVIGSALISGLAFKLRRRRSRC